MPDTSYLDRCKGQCDWLGPGVGVSQLFFYSTPIQNALHICGNFLWPCKCKVINFFGLHTEQAEIQTSSVKCDIDKVQS